LILLLDQEPTIALKDKIRGKLYEIKLETDKVISIIILQKEEWAKKQLRQSSKSSKKKD